ncbi:DUF2785 domain-containing protein [Saccharibacillus sp. CPCC 101409]|uniref:DUF2785 domain-containing protein n=1 Tax=Saccharibacillus sp. CPCC 101409 TaxID=3058041 RepID=UPI002673E26F|nr:DUF2785 domain-containing protein [Saccharibacillus sp. CPCC 101409]MDO3410821.1 DUF2785 domain-containing protein [Saccharibacillus sp. CPCC 101409]
MRKEFTSDRDSAPGIGMLMRAADQAIETAPAQRTPDMPAPERPVTEAGGEAPLREELRRTLRELRLSGLRPEAGRLDRLLAAMLEHIGDPDPELRDELIYGSFSDWIQAGALGAQQLLMLANAALDERHLFYRIGENGSDSVFTRSFSVLLLPLILSADRAAPFLADRDWRRLLEAALRYAAQERDVRGPVPEGGKGWAHAAAHTGDALEDLAQSPQAGPAERLNILEALRLRLRSADRVFVFDEDERLAAAAETALTRGGLEPGAFDAWLQRLGEPAEDGAAESFEEAARVRVNARLFLERLHARLLAHPSAAEQAEAVRLRGALLRME